MKISHIEIQSTHHATMGVQVHKTLLKINNKPRMAVIIESSMLGSDNDCDLCGIDAGAMILTREAIVNEWGDANNVLYLCSKCFGKKIISVKGKPNAK